MPDDTVLDRWEAAADELVWGRRWDAVHEAGERGGRWFPGARLNATESCLDHHLPELAGRVAFHWEGEPGDRRTISYGELHEEVCLFADALRGLGIDQGDRVALYMGFLPETIVAMLACARIGAVHAVMSSALPADALADRLADLDPRVLVTQDGAWRHGVILPLKARADDAIPAAAAIEHTIVVRRTGIDVDWYEGDRWYDDLVARPRPGTPAPASEPPSAVDSDHPLLVVYIANRRGRPMGIVHGTGGFLTYAATLHRGAFGPEPDDVLWCAVEVAWLTGQSHAVYGPLACGATSVVYEGMLDTPTHGRAWEAIERYGVTSFTTTFSVLRTLRRFAGSPPTAGQLDSLRRVITAGEPTDPDVLAWLRRRLPDGAVVADGWGQTELGAGVHFTDLPPSVVGVPSAGLDVVDENGDSLEVGVAGELVLRSPWPAMFLGVQNGGSELETEYWASDGDAYATGDRAVREPDGSFAFLGRIDPMVSVSGQLVSLTEVGEALLEHPFVDDAVIVERLERQTGPTLAACIVLVDGVTGDDELADALREHVRERLGGLAQPRTVVFAECFPDEVGDATRSLALQALLAGAASDVLFISADELRSTAAALPSP